MGADLITLAEYKAYVGITSPDQDTLISSLITKVSALVKSICKRSFVDYVSTNKVEYFNGVGNFVFGETPLISVTSVEVSYDYGSTYTPCTLYTDYYISPSTSEIIFITGDSFVSANKYKVTYKCGYTSIPEDLKLAVLDLVKYYIKNDAVIHTAKGASANSVSISYVTNTKLPPHITRVLELYMEHYA